MTSATTRVRLKLFEREPSLWPLDLKGVDFPIPRIPGNQRRIVGREAKPVSERSRVKCSPKILQALDQLEFSIAHLQTVNRPRRVSGRDVEVDVFDFY